MHKVTLVLAFLSCTSHGRRMQAINRQRPSTSAAESRQASTSSNAIPSSALSSLLLAFNPTPAFTSAGQGLHFSAGSPTLAARPGAIMVDGALKLTRRELAAAAATLPVAAQAQAKVLSPVAPFAKQPGFALNTGTNFPTASFGLQVYDDNTAEKLTTIALEAGFRNFFASVLARNQKGFAKAIKKSGIPREELFICGSVLSNQAEGFNDAYQLSKKGCNDNLKAFAVGGIDYVDMIMLDYPGPDDESILGQWKALEEMKKAGLTRSLAVSNFNSRQLDVILQDKTATVPTVNQLPYGVGFARNYGGNAREVVEENNKRGVLVQAWSPLGRFIKRPDVKQACQEIGNKYNKSAAQVALRWIADTGATYTTQTKTKAHFEEDIDIFDFKLTPEEVDTLAKL